MVGLTWIAIHVHVFVSPNGTAKTGGQGARGPLANQNLGRRVLESTTMSVVNKDQSLLVFPSKRAANGYIWKSTHRDSQSVSENMLPP